jgi:MSHA pilin protein MshA
MNKQRGFTLIELVAVIVILAILAVVAVPQFVDLRVDAANAGAAGVGGAVASGTALNYARGVARNGGASTVAGCDGQQFAPLVVGATSSAATNLTLGGRTYTVGGTAAGLTSGAGRSCTIQDTSISGTAAQAFSIIGCATAACG